MSVLADELRCGEGNDALILSRAGNDDRGGVVALQFAAYARNRELLGVEPLPLQVNYAEVFANYEVWVARYDDDRIRAALILEIRPDDLLIWSVSSDPEQQGGGLGNALLRGAESRARALGHRIIRLYTGAILTHLIEWYGRRGFEVEHIEELPDRKVTHMIKCLP